MHEFFEVCKTKLVPIFMLAIVFAMFLDSIICQVNEVIVQFGGIHTVGLAWCPDITFSEEKNLELMTQEHPYPNVKLALIDK